MEPLAVPWLRCMLMPFSNFPRFELAPSWRRLTDAKWGHGVGWQTGNFLDNKEKVLEVVKVHSQRKGGDKEVKGIHQISCRPHCWASLFFFLFVFFNTCNRLFNLQANISKWTRCPSAPKWLVACQVPFPLPLTFRKRLALRMLQLSSVCFLFLTRVN